MDHDPDGLARDLLSHPTAMEARAWLSIQDGTVRTLGESASPDNAHALVEAFYESGALQVVVTEVDRYEIEDLEGASHYENTGHLVIKLPDTAHHRRKVFRIQAKIARSLGFDPTPDTGQHYLCCMLD